MRLLTILFLLLTHTSLFAQVRLARLFSDHVVLQRQKPIPVWGWANPGEKLTLVLAGQSQSAKADASGKWTALFTPLEAGGPHTLTVHARSGKAVVQDILIGEVWLCSGQSNIEWPVSKADRYEEEKKHANFPQIRHFEVRHKVSLVPENDLEAGEWELASPETVGDFSAIGFFFARELYQKLNIPVGILHTSWGGSQIEGWLSKEAMLSNDELKGYAQNLPVTWEKADEMMDAKLRRQLFGDASINPSAEDEKKYLAPEPAISKWHKTSDPIGQWDWKGLMAFRGQGYMGKIIEIPASLAMQPTMLSLAENDSKNEVYINGKAVYSEAAKGVKRISIPANTWKEGTNTLVIKLGNMVETPWFGPGFIGKSSDLFLEGASGRIALDKDWNLMPSFAEKHDYVHLMNNVGTSIYNAMIVPLIPFGIRGTLWYQGESNAGRAYQYRQSFPLLINDWRRAWAVNDKRDNFSFYWVQLSSFGSDSSSNKGSGWAELREAQNQTLSLPNTGMAVTIDVGTPGDVHPTNKQDVAHRLAACALKNDYGQAIPFSSPLYESFQIEGNKAVVHFKYADDGLMAKDRYGYVKGFEIAGDDQVFYYAKAIIQENNVIVSHPNVSKPVSVRYAWSDAPAEANLYNQAGFPASGFRTDNWPATTINNKFE